jgi:hypothetical protein
MNKKLKAHKIEVEHGERGLQRQWDRFDADTNEKKAYPSPMVAGAQSILISRQRDYIEALEAEIKRLKKTANLDDGYIEFLEAKRED